MRESHPLMTTMTAAKRLISSQRIPHQVNTSSYQREAHMLYFNVILGISEYTARVLSSILVWGRRSEVLVGKGLQS